MTGERLHGLMIEFLTADAVLSATRRARQAGYRRMDAFTPHPVEGLAQELGMRTTRLPMVVLIGGIVGSGIGFFMQYYASRISYPLNVGGRPLNSWPAYIPVTFELLILIAALSAFVGMMLLNGLPRPNHPLFNVPEFVRASQDRYFLCIEATDAKFDREETAAFLATLDPNGPVLEVPNEASSGGAE
jgi:hypothetical protein